MAEVSANAADSEPNGAASQEASGGLSFGKRKRLHGACDACRRKKTKCDSAIKPDNICSNCINCRIQCTHESSRRKKRPDVVQPTNMHLQALEDRLKTMEAYLRTVGQPIPPNDDSRPLHPILPQPPVSPIVVQSASTLPQLATSAAAFQLEDRSSHRAAASASFTIQPAAGTIPPPVDENDISDPDDLAHVTLAERLKNLSFDITENRFFGKSSMFLYAQNCMEFKNQRSGTTDGNFARTKRPIFWQLRDWEREYLRIKDCNYDFPEPDLLESLLTLYFDNVHILFPVLHRPTFEKEIKMQLHLRDHSFAAVLLIVCAIASRFSTDPRVYLNADDDSSAGWKYISQIPLTSSMSLVQPNLYDLQRNALGAIYYQGSSMNHTAWNLTGLGLRLAQDSGLHRRQRAHYQPTKESELKRRAFWCLVAMDRTMSSLLGRPCALYGEDIDVDYPLECDDEYWETTDPSQAFMQPPDKPSFMITFIAYLRLCDIIGSMLRTLYSTKKCRVIHGLIGENWEVRIVAELDASLLAWKQSLPRHLRWNPEATNRMSFNQALFLNAAFCYVRIQIHRPLLHRDRLTSSSFTVCRQVAKDCSHLLQSANARAGVSNPHVIMAAFASALTLVIDLWAKREFVTPDEVSEYNTNIESCLEYIRRAENRWHGAARMVDMITEFRSVRKVSAQGELGDAPQLVPFSSAHVPSHVPSQISLASSSTSSLDDYSFSSLSSTATTLSTPSPPSITSLNTHEAMPAPPPITEPNDTPFNFDFSNIQTGIGSAYLSHYDYKQDFTQSLSTDDGGAVVNLNHFQHPGQLADGTTTLWTEAPFSYSIREWDSYIASLERFASQ